MILDEHSIIAHIKRLTRRDLSLWIREGWVCPAQGEMGPVFDELDVARLRLLCDLQQDIGLPTDMMPRILGLIDKLHQARRDLRRLTVAVENSLPMYAARSSTRAEGLRTT